MKCPECGCRVIICAYYDAMTTIACIDPSCWEQPIKGTLVEREINTLLEKLPQNLVDGITLRSIGEQSSEKQEG